MAGNQLQVFVVRRLNWQYGDDFYYRDEAGDAPMKTFLDRGKAEAHRRQLEWDHVRSADVNPFGWVDAALEERSTLPSSQLMRRLRQAGLRLEEDEDTTLSLWDQYKSLSESQQRLVWEAIDRIRFFELVEMTVEIE